MIDKGLTKTVTISEEHYNSLLKKNIELNRLLSEMTTRRHLREVREYCSEYSRQNKDCCIECEIHDWCKDPTRPRNPKYWQLIEEE